ncbi:MAG: EF-P lysine aminoacylase EpmA [Xanthobacteraceae bacterium]
MADMDKDTPWWDRQIHVDRRGLLLARAGIRNALRGHFVNQGFVEVDAGILQVSPGNEAHLHAFATDLQASDGGVERRYLHTSPEFACKKLLAAGEEKIFDFARVFRNRERSVLHHPEFTMLEWYRANAPYNSVMDDCVAILREAAKVTGNAEISFRNKRCDPFAMPERLSVARAFAKYASIDLPATLTGATGDRNALASQAASADIAIAADDTWSDIFSKVLVARVEPNLGIGCPTLLDEYPAVEAALARPAAHDPRFAERFEFYVCGVELANGFGELTDAREQRRRFEIEMAEKQRIYGERYPIDEDFLAALAHMPPASGCALGFDRLVMLTTGAQRIDEVIWTPVVE